MFSKLAKKYNSNASSPIPLIIFANDIIGAEFRYMIEKDYREHSEFINATRKSTKLKYRKLVVIIDGLDECKSGQIQTLLREVKDLICDNVYVILTTRPIEDIINLVNKEIPKTQRIELVSKKEIDWSLVGFPSSIDTYRNDNNVFIGQFFEFVQIIKSIQSPLFIKLINEYFSRCGEISKEWLTDAKFPITLNRLLIEFYNV